MATSIQVELIVDEKGAVQVIRSFGASVQGAGGNVKQLDASLVQMNQHLDQVGVKSQAIRQIGEHSITSLDKVRLLRDDLDIRIPRAMEKIIAHSQLAMTAINAMGGALLAAGGIMMAWSFGKEIFDGLKKLNDDYFSLTKAAQDYNAEVAKAKAQDFGDAHSIETISMRLQEATDNAEKLRTIAQQMSSISWLDIGMEGAFGSTGAAVGLLGAKSSTGDMARGAADAQRQADKLQKAGELEQAHQRNVEQIDLNHALDGELSRRKQIAAELQKERDLNAETRRYHNQMDAFLGNPVAPNAGKSEMDVKDAIASAQAQAKTSDLNKEQTAELQHLRDQAAESVLRGEARYAKQESDAIAELKGTDKDTVEFRNALHEKFHADEMGRLAEEARETAKIGRQASLAGLTGLGKIQAEGANRIADINADDNLSPVARAARIADARRETDAEMLAAQRQFSDQIESISDASAAHQISGFAKIEAEARRQLDQLQRKFDEVYGQIDVFAQGGIEAYAAGAAQLDRGKAAIGAGSQDEKAELVKRGEDETQEIEAAARAKSLSGEKQKTAAIAAEYQERLRKYRSQMDAEIAGAAEGSAEQAAIRDQYNRKVAAAAEEMNAELRQQAQETAQKIAGELSGLFGAHPLEALERMGQKYAGEATAALLSRAMGAGAAPGSGSPKGAALAALFSRFGGRDRETETQHAPLVSGPGIISLQSATIHVGSASFLMGGAGAAAGGNTRAMGGGYGAPGGLYDPLGAPSTGTGVGGGAGGSGITFASGTPVGAPPLRGGGAMSVGSTVLQGINTTRSIAAMIASGNGPGSGSGSGLETTNTMPGGHFNPDGSYSSDASAAAGAANPSAYSQSMLGGGLTAQNTMGSVGPAIGLFSAYKQGGAGGMMSGAMSGAELGMEVGGPIGAAVGAAAGLAIGFMGGGEQARVFWEKQGRPRLEQDVFNYQTNGDFLTAMSDMQALGQQARMTLTKMGSTGTRYWESTANPELRDAEEKLNREQRAGRSASGFSGAQYAIGSPFIPEDQIAKVHHGERIFSADHNERMTRAFEGAMGHASYRNAMQPSGAGRSMAQISRGPELHLHAIDAKSSLDFLLDNADAVRAAANKALGDYGGYADVTA